MSHRSFKPKAFKQFLISSDPAFALLAPPIQNATAEVLYFGVSRSNQHITKLDGVFPVFWKDTKRNFKSAEAFNSMNDECDYFKLEVGAQVGFCARGWRLTTRAIHLVKNYLATSAALVVKAMPKAEIGLETPDGKTYSTPAKAIRSITMTGANTRFKGHDNSMRSAVEINGEALHAFHTASEAWLVGEPSPRDFEWLHESLNALRRAPGINGGEQRAVNRAKTGIMQASVLLDIAKRSNVIGYVVPMTYLEHESGRLYAEGSMNLQGCLREVRRAALMGCWDVDVDNCHWSILSQLAGRQGIKTNHISTYLATKQETRETIAKDVDLPVADVKELLVAMIYGARMSESHDGTNSLEILLGKDAVKRVCEHELVQGLASDIKAAKNAIINHYKVASRHQGRDVIVNDAKREINLKGLSKDQQLAHILQGIESEILRACMTRVARIVLLAHDGFVSMDRVNIEELQAFVGVCTGFHVTFSQKRV